EAERPVLEDVGQLVAVVERKWRRQVGLRAEPQHQRHVGERRQPEAQEQLEIAALRWPAVHGTSSVEGSAAARDEEAGETRSGRIARASQRVVAAVPPRPVASLRHSSPAASARKSIPFQMMGVARAARRNGTNPAAYFHVTRMETRRE